MIRAPYADAIAALWLLVNKFPRTFFMLETRHQPLAIGIRDQIITTGAIEPDQLNLALQFYCRSNSYLRAMARGGARIGLTGNEVGVVTPEQMAGAAKGLAARLARKKARRPACSSSETPVPAPAARSACAEPVPAGPKRLGLADLRQLAQARKEKELAKISRRAPRHASGAGGFPFLTDGCVLTAREAVLNRSQHTAAHLGPC